LLSALPAVEAATEGEGTDGDRSRGLPHTFGFPQEKKELQSMKKHRGLFLGLGLSALLALAAGPAKAETLTISVIYGGATYSFAGGSNSITVPNGVINGDLAGSGYTFSGLGGSSNFPGSNTSVGATITDSGTLTQSGGTGGPITVILAESGFTMPTGTGAAVTAAPVATFSGTTAGDTQTDVATYTGTTTVSTPMTTLTSNGTTSDSHSTSASAPIPSYVTPFTLMLTETFSLTQRSASSAMDSLGSTASVTATIVPEPASLIMMVTGMPLPLVVMGLLRRRRAAA
jgi:hypothetical protein